MAKYQFLTSAEHEAILSAGVGVEWGDTGARKVGAEPQTTITPTLYFGKGAGDLPEDLALLKPLAVTGLIGYAVPTDSRHVRQNVDPETGEIEEDVDNRAQTLVTASRCNTACRTCRRTSSISACRPCSPS